MHASARHHCGILAFDILNMAAVLMHGFRELLPRINWIHQTIWHKLRLQLMQVMERDLLDEALLPAVQTAPIFPPSFDQQMMSFKRKGIQESLGCPTKSLRNALLLHRRDSNPSIPRFDT